MSELSIIEHLENELAINNTWYEHYCKIEPRTSIAMLYLGRVTVIEELLKELYKKRVGGLF